MRTLSLFLLICVSSLNAQTPDTTIEGTWKGDLVLGERKMDIIVAFKLSNDKWSGNLSSQKQQLKDIAISKIQYTGDSLSFEVPLAGGKWSGQLIKLSRLTGTWTQGPYEIPLDFDLQNERFALNIQKREQTPVAPFPYLVKEVTYENHRDGTKLAGTLTLPKGRGPFPAAILLTVAGPNDRDQTHSGPQHKPFLVLADHLTKNGFAVLRADDRGVGGSEGDIFKSTIEDFAHDALAGFDFLTKQPEINAEKIGYIGNSEGTLVGPLAASINDKVAYIITLGGMSIPGSEVILDQVEAIGEIAKFTEQEISKVTERTQTLFQILNEEPDNEKLKNRLITILKEDEGKGNNDEFLMPQSAEEQAQLFATDWYRFQVNYDPRPILQKTTIPFLAINGSLDPFVNPDKNLEGFAKHLNIAGNSNFSVVKLKNLNHVFQDATSGSSRFYSENETSFSPRALALILTWLNISVK